MKHLDQTMIKECGFSAPFISALEAHGYLTVEDVLSITLTDFSKMEWFTPELLQELHEWKKRGSQRA